MKSFYLFFFFLCLTVTCFAQQKVNSIATVDATKPVLLVETACGQCRLGLKGKGCNLAVRIKDKAYFVDGTDIDSHGDAHAEDGFCNAVRKANVQGTIVNNRFHATYFQLADSKLKKQKP